VATALGHGDEERRRLLTPSTGLDAHLNEIERHVPQGAVEIVDGPSFKAEAASGRRPGEDQGQGVGASGQVG
jgi:hypothetical protein